MSIAIDSDRHGPGQRGPAGHEMRERILQAAEARFRHFGYAKTNVADIAKDLGVSSAYVYKFFDSKLAINEAVTSDVLQRVADAIWTVARGKGSAGDRLRGVFVTLLEESIRLYFDDRRLHDMVLTAVENRWEAVSEHRQTLIEVVSTLIREGRVSGEFEALSDESRTVDAIRATMTALACPHVLQQTIDEDLEARAEAVADLVLSGLRA